MKLAHGLHQESPRMVKLEVGLHNGCLGSDPRSLKVVKLVHGLHQESPRMVELEVGLHDGYLDSDHRNLRVVELVMWLHHGSPRVVKLVMRLYQGCYLKEHEVSQGGEASDGASTSKMQEGERSVSKRHLQGVRQVVHALFVAIRCKDGT